MVVELLEQQPGSELELQQPGQDLEELQQLDLERLPVRLKERTICETNIIHAIASIRLTCVLVIFERSNIGFVFNDNTN